MNEQWRKSKEQYTKGDTWVDAVARIRNNATGEVREYPTQVPIYQGEVEPSDYMWSDGNYQCDCNRSLFFLGIRPGEEGEAKCGDDAYSVQLVNPVSGRVFYDEFAPHLVKKLTP